MTGISGSAPEACYEQQRFEHLVLGRPRPALPAQAKKSKRRARPPAQLAPGVEEAVQLRERWSHKEGTAQTHEQFSRRQAGAIARLHQSGAIDDDQLAFAQQIDTAFGLIGADVLVKTASLETRVDTTRMGDGNFYEALGRVRLEVAYSAWRAMLPRPALVLEIIAGDAGLATAAALHHTSKRKAKQLLLDALDHWPRCHAEARRRVDPATLAAAQAGIL